MFASTPQSLVKLSYNNYELRHLFLLIPYSVLCTYVSPLYLVCGTKSPDPGGGHTSLSATPCLICNRQVQLELSIETECHGLMVLEEERTLAHNNCLCH